MRSKLVLTMLSSLVTVLLISGEVRAEDYPSTYAPLPSEPTLITHATILTGTGERLDDASLLIAGGKIVFVGQGDVPATVATIDAGGRWVTPGLIDATRTWGCTPAPT